MSDSRASDAPQPVRPLRRRSDLPGNSGVPDARTLEGLIHLGALLASTLSLHGAASQVVEYGCILTGLPAFALFVMADDGGELRAAATEGIVDDTAGVRLRPIDIAALDLERTGPRLVAVASLGSPEFAALCARHGYDEAWTAPLVVAGVRLKGLLVGLGRRHGEPVAGDLLRVFRLLALQATSAVWNAERHESEQRAQRDLLHAQRHIAVTLQENFIHPLPDIAGLDLALVTETAHAPELVGGDFHDVFTVPDGRVIVLLGDVEGKGVRAAGMTETVRTAVSSFALVDAEPGFILRKTNELLLLRRNGPDDQFVTAFLLTLDLSTGEAAYASAGHPAPLLVRPQSCGFLETTFGVPLGTFPCDYPGGHVALAPGDCVALFTDGITEARVGTALFGECRLAEALCDHPGIGPHEVAVRLRDAALAYAGRWSDDMQILAFSLSGSPRPQGPALRVGA
jgi:serine phosphatase RsbU (regulator of sigma subunit)